MKNSKIPKKLQGVLWSVDVKDLDLNKNKSYIINQILSIGTQDELQWLFKIYPLTTIKETFEKLPAKIYTHSAFNFSKNILLGMDNYNPPLNKYVKTLPRNIR